MSKAHLFPDIQPQNQIDNMRRRETMRRTRKVVEDNAGTVLWSAAAGLGTYLIVALAVSLAPVAGACFL